MNNDTGIYTITSPSGKRYVGSTSSFRRRWAKHLLDLRAGKHHSQSLQRAYDKYGEAALVFEKVALCLITELVWFEQQFIDSMKPEYNVAPRAGSTLGVKLGPHSAEHRRKIGDAHLGRTLTDEVKRQIGDFHRGKKLSESHLARLSSRNKGTGNPFFGRKHDPATLSRLSGDGHHSARAVICIETGTRFPSITAAKEWLREHGKPRASSSPILECCRGSTRYKRPYGYTWRYETAMQTGSASLTQDMFA